MQKQSARQVVYSKNKSISEMRKCRRHNCKGCEKHYQNFLETTSRQTRSNEKSLSTGNNRVKQFSEPKLKYAISVRSHKPSNIEEMLRAENKDLSERLSEKRKKLSKVRLQLKKCQQELQELRLQLEQYRGHSQEKHQQKIDNQRSLFQNVMESQSLARETLEKYRILQQEYHQYRESSEKKISDLKKEMIDNLRHQIKGFDERVAKILLDYEQIISKLKEEHAITIRRVKAELTDSAEKSRNSDLFRELRNEVRELERANKQLRHDIENRESNFQSKERNFKENLNRITQRVENWTEEVDRIRELELSNLELAEKYERLLEKYRLKKLRQKQLSREWAQIFREFLEQVSRMKRQMDNASQVSFK